MISFIVLGGPRSATTWAANWLTTDETLCLHDPLLEYSLVNLGQLYFPGKRLGISCTSMLLWPEWIRAQRCPKIILFRNIHEINNSLRALGLDELGPAQHYGRLDAVRGIPTFPYEALFAPKLAQKIASILGTPWDASRHDLLRQMRIEPAWNHLNVGKEAAQQLIQRIQEAR